MKKHVIDVMGLVSGTSTNSEALPLFIEMDKAILENKSVVLSLKSCTPMSSSFLNSSVGALIDKHGFNILQGRFSISDYTPSLADNLKSYIAKFKVIAAA